MTRLRFLLHRVVGIGGCLQGRLHLYHLALIVILIALALLLMGTLNIFSPQKRIAANLQAHMDRYEQQVTAYFSNTAAQGIRLSRLLTQRLERTLENQNAQFSQVSDNRALISRLERSAYDLLYNALLMTDCSGVFVIFDATVNTALPHARDSRCGLYLKLANINVSRPVMPEVALMRGVPEIGHARQIIFHNKWELEFSLAALPLYHRLLQNASPDLDACYVYTPALRIGGTWEKAMFLCVPLVGSRGEVYGICGFEISALFFKLAHAESSAPYARLTGLVAQQDGATILAGSGHESGTQEGYFAELGNSALTVEPGAALNHYTVQGPGKREFVGVDRTIFLAPLADREDTFPWTAACFIPREDYSHMLFLSYLKLAAFCALLFAGAALLSHFIVRRYSKPILQSLSAIKSGKRQQVHIHEIDDLMDFLARNDREAKRESVDSLRAADAGQMADLSAFSAFKEGIARLSKAESAVFNLYMQGHSAADITQKLFISINTVKTHNKNIYRKLNVTSLKELRVYAQMLGGMPDGQPRQEG